MSKEHWTVSSILKAVFLSMSGLGSSTSVMSRSDKTSTEPSDHRKTLDTGSKVSPALLRQSENTGADSDESPLLSQ